MLLNSVMLILSVLVLQMRIPVTYKYVKTEKISKSLSFSRDTAREFVVDIFNGSISVTGYDGPTAEIVVRKTLHAKSESAMALAEQHVSIEIGKAGDGKLLVSLHVPWKLKNGGMEDQNLLRYDYDVSCDVEVKLPRNTKLKARMIDKGDISVRGMSGPFELNHAIGNIVMEEISGSGSAMTVTGNITARFSLSPAESTRLSTVMGGIDVFLPNNLAANLSVSAGNGRATTEFDATPLPHATSVETRGQKRIYKISDATRLKVGTGGPELSFETMSGNIRVMKNDKGRTQ